MYINILVEQSIRVRQHFFFYCTSSNYLHLSTWKKVNSSNTNLIILIKESKGEEEVVQILKQASLKTNQRSKIVSMVWWFLINHHHSRTYTTPFLLQQISPCKDGKHITGSISLAPNENECSPCILHRHSTAQSHWLNTSSAIPFRTSFLFFPFYPF